LYILNHVSILNWHATLYIQKAFEGLNLEAKLELLSEITRFRKDQNAVLRIKQTQFSPIFANGVWSGGIALQLRLDLSLTSHLERPYHSFISHLFLGNQPSLSFPASRRTKWPLASPFSPIQHCLWQSHDWLLVRKLKRHLPNS
jgi:hypothetical protein